MKLNKKGKTRKFRSTKDAPNLQRFRTAVEQLALSAGDFRSEKPALKNLSESEGGENLKESDLQYRILVKGKSRKQKRKEDRKMRKAMKHAFLSKQPVGIILIVIPITKTYTDTQFTAYYKLLLFHQSTWACSQAGSRGLRNPSPHGEWVSFCYDRNGSYP